MIEHLRISFSGALLAVVVTGLFTKEINYQYAAAIVGFVVFYIWWSKK